MSSGEVGSFFDRDELLAGSPTKRANAVLFLIENRTSLLVDQSRRQAQRLLSEDAARDRDLDFLEAFALGREPRVRPAIQDLERFAADWASLVPANPRIQAAVAKRLGERYHLHHRSIPGIRDAIEMDDPDVRKAYRALYGAPLESLYISTTTVAERARWRWTSFARWLESLPPFWTAYALTLTETVGATILALPIALASVGPLPALVIIVALGLINVLTVAYMSEAVARSGQARQGNAYFGRIVRDYLGDTGSNVLSGGLFLLCLLVVPVFYIGVATTLEDVVPIGAPVWTAVLFAVGLYYLRREALNATISSALVIGAVNLILILSLSALALANARLDNLMYMNVPFIGGRPFEAAIITLIFGVVLAAYFGHTSVVLCGRLVLRRDPTGRSLMRGCVAAQITAILLYGLFVVAVNGAVGSESLSGESGTALGPLAGRIGTLATALGATFVILGMGMGSIHFSLALFNIVRERLPSGTSRTLVLPAHRSVLSLTRRRPFGRRDDLTIRWVYRGSLGGRVAFDLEALDAGTVYRERIMSHARWNLEQGDGDRLREALPRVSAKGVRLTLTVDAADELSARLRVETNMHLDLYGDAAPGVGLSTLLSLDDEQIDLVSWLLREGEATMSAIAAYLQREESDVEVRLLAPLVKTGLVRKDNSSEGALYSFGFARRRFRELSDQVWAALESEPPVPKSERGAPARRPNVTRALTGSLARFLVPATPVFVAFALTEWMLVTDSASFAGLIGFVGTIVVSLLAGIFPVLLLVSSRRKGEYSTPALRVLARPWILGGIYVFFLAGLLLHGLVIWDDAWERLGAVGAFAVTLGMTAAMMRSGAFGTRLTLELRTDRAADGRTKFRLASGGRAVVSEVSLEYPESTRELAVADAEIPEFASLRRATFTPLSKEDALPAEIKVSAHAVGEDGSAEPLAAIVEIDCGDVTTFDLRLERGEVVVPVHGREWQIDLVFPETGPG